MCMRARVCEYKYYRINITYIHKIQKKNYIFSPNLKISNIELYIQLKKNQKSNLNSNHSQIYIEIRNELLWIDFDNCFKF